MVQSFYDCSLVGKKVQVARRDTSTYGLASPGLIQVSFHRTVRVPDTHDDESFLPPGLGRFPLYKVNDFKSTLPKNMAAKGGLLLPIYRKLTDCLV